MAVLNNIRKHGIFLIVIIALALFSFVLADVIRQGGLSFGDSQNVVGTINGKEITNLEFDNRVQGMRQNYPPEVSSTLITNQAWDATVKQTLIEDQIEKAGIEIGPRQLSAALARQFGQNQEFTTNGQFDVNKFKAYLEQLRAINPEVYAQWLQTENQVIDQSKIETYFGLVQAGTAVTPTEAKEIYKLNNTRFDLEYVKIPFAAINDDAVSISDQEIKQYIDTHQKQFKTNGLRDLRFVLFEEKPTAEDEQAVKEELTGLLEDHETYNKAAGIEETEKGFKNTTDYEQFLSENSDLPFEDSFLFKDDLPKTVADSLFSLQTGAAFGPYKDNGFWKYSKLIEEHKMADSVELKHILISYQGLQTGQNTSRTAAQAEQLADSILKVVKKEPKKFADLAMEFSDDTSSKVEGGELGWIPHAQNNQNEILDFAFSNDPGSVKVIQTQFGYHVVAIQDSKDKQRVIKLATLAKEIHPSDQTLNDLFNNATKFQVAATDGDFDQVAEENGYAVKLAKNLEPLDENLPGIGAHRNIVKWAFDKENKVGDITRFDTDLGYVVAQITAATTKGIKDVEAARNEVTSILLRKKKGAYLKENLSSTDLSEIATTYGVAVRKKEEVSLANPNIDGNEPAVVGHAFGLEKNSLSQPLVGRSGIYILKLIDRKDPEDISSYNGIISQENQKMPFSPHRIFLRL